MNLNRKPARRKSQMNDSEPTVIRSVSHAIPALKWLKRNFFREKIWTPHKFPFGMWFRGQPREGLELEPRVFRDRLHLPDEIDENAMTATHASHEKRGCWDETNVFDHLKLLAPSHEHTYHSAFDWLCLMQHYSVPTRLLDWSESFLSALYFAVRDVPGTNGELIVLNAKELNVRSKTRPTISDPENGHVVIRAEMATTRSLAKLTARACVLQAIAEDPIELRGGDWMQSCLRPIAVFPRRLNERMILQTSVFTLQGGKIYSAKMRKYYPLRDRIPEPVTLAQVDREADAPILKRIRIPKRAKKTILDELFSLGVHEALLFPEIDRQADYLQRLWWYPERRRP